jgi:hypothetical protein
VCYCLLYRGISDFRNIYQPITNIAKDEKGDLVTDCDSVLARWRNLFSQLLNVLGGPGKLSWCSDSLWTGRSRDRISVGARFYTPFQTGPGALCNGYQVSLLG